MLASKRCDYSVLDVNIDSQLHLPAHLFHPYVLLQAFSSLIFVVVWSRH
jgi:hypothetical protein